MTSNPFDDPDVKASQTGKFYGDGAYDPDPHDYEQKRNKASEQIEPKNAETMGLIVNESKPDIKAQPAQNQNISYHPPPEPPEFCVRLFNWLPVQFLAFIGGCAFIALPILHLVFQTVTFLSFFVDIYMIVFGLAIIAVEMPSWPIARKAQLAIYFWARFMGRMWGRALLYLFISFLSFSQLGSSFSITALAGFYLIIVAFFMLIISKSACRKYLRIYAYIAGGQEGDALFGVFQRKFEELDIDRDGFISGESINKIAHDAGRNLSNAERHAIFTFLDESCNGRISKQDWIKQFMTYNGVKNKLKHL